MRVQYKDGMKEGKKMLFTVVIGLKSGKEVSGDYPLVEAVQRLNMTKMYPEIVEYVYFKWPIQRQIIFGAKFRRTCMSFLHVIEISRRVNSLFPLIQWFHGIATDVYGKSQSMFYLNKSNK